MNPIFTFVPSFNIEKGGRRRMGHNNENTVYFMAKRDNTMGGRGGGRGS